MDSTVKRGSGWKWEDGGRGMLYGFILTSSIMTKGTGCLPPPLLWIIDWLFIDRWGLCLSDGIRHTHTHTHTHSWLHCNTVQWHVTLLKVIEKESSNVCIINDHTETTQRSRKHLHWCLKVISIVFSLSISSVGKVTLEM